MTDDIDLSSIANWKPIGTLTNPFTGKLDGNGYTISNLVINRAEEDCVGLFGVCNAPKSKYAPGDNSVLADPIFKNIKLSNIEVKGRDMVGGFIGKIVTDIGEGNDYRVVSSDYGFLCDNVSANGSVSGRSYVGGLIGKAEGPPYAGYGPDAPEANIMSYMVHDFIIGFKTIQTSTLVSGSGDYVGGVVGHSTGVRFYFGRSSGNVSGKNHVGGIAGGSNMIIFGYCTSLGDVSGTGWVAGGICGIAASREDFEQCCSYGNISAPGYHPYNYADGDTAFSRLESGVGGIVGVWADINFMHECCSYGNVTGERAGGLIGTGQGGGSNWPNIYDCFSRGEIKGARCSGSIMGAHFAPSSGSLEIGASYSLGKVSGGISGAVVGHKGPIYDMIGAGCPPIVQEWAPKYEGNIAYITSVIVNGDRNTASLQHGGLRRTEQQMRSVNTYKVAWPANDPALEINGSHSCWLLHPDVDWFPVLRWLHRPRTTMLSSVFSRTLGLVLGYSQTSETSYQDYSKTVSVRRLLSGDWSDAQEITELSGSDPRIGVFKTRDGKIGVVSNKDDMLHMVATGTGSMAISESQSIEEMNIKGVYGSITQTSDAGGRLIYYIPQAGVETLAYINTTYTGSWDNSKFTNPATILSGLNLSFLRTKEYISQSIITYRSGGKHHVLFPDIPWNEDPALPIPDENDPKFGYTITVLDETDNPIEGAEVSITKPYYLGTETLYTDENGEAFFELWALNYRITISKAGYFLQEDILYIANVGEKTFTLYALKSNVTFNVAGEDVGQLAEALIEFNSEAKETSSSGQATFYDVPLRRHDYTITHDDFVTVNDSVTIIEVYETLNPSMLKKTGTVKFVVTDAGSAAISGASVTFNDETIDTDPDGIAEFAPIKYGDGYNYSVSATGYVAATGTVNVHGETVDVAIELQPE